MIQHWLHRRKKAVRWRLHRWLGADDSDATRLHLGCGRDYRHGYTNIDNDPDAWVDLRMDIRSIGSAFSDESVEEILGIHVLNYLRLWEARELLENCYHLLKDGSPLVLEFTDLQKCAERIARSEGNLEDHLEATRAIFGFDLTQVDEKERFQPKAFGWSEWHLQRELEGLGFCEVRTEEPRTHGPRPARDSRVVAIR